VRLEDVPLWFILDAEGDPQAVDLPTYLAWMAQHYEAHRVVLQTHTARGRISTVFLGVNHDPSGDRPVVWETRVISGAFDGWTSRYASRLDAIRGHARIQALLEGLAHGPRRTKKALHKFAVTGLGRSLLEQWVDPRRAVTFGRRERIRIHRALHRAARAGQEPR
jgi:hypothetical protein